MAASSEHGDQPAAPIEPLDTDGVTAMSVGTVLWAVGLIALLIAGVRPSDSNGWWLWVCVAGMVIGLLGIGYSLRRRAAYRSAHH